MRPGDFSPGNSAAAHLVGQRYRFNEAGGFLPRKHGQRCLERLRQAREASMRPGDFSPGNLTARWPRGASPGELLQ